MSDKTAISWTDATWNPIRGCSRVSEGCRHCYAERQALRITRMDRGAGKPEGQGAYDGLVREVGGEARWTGQVRLVPELLDQPLRWRRPRWIFVNSMSDLFHESLPFEAIQRVYNVMAGCPQHVFQVLTKRPARRLEFVEWIKAEARQMGAACFWPLPNVWEGISAEDQATLDARWPDLRRCPAAVRWVSLEPQLGPVTFRTRRCGGCQQDREASDCDCPAGSYDMARYAGGTPEKPWGLDWIVQGGESGPGARPFDLAWARSVRDQCKAAGVAYYLKQVGARPFCAPTTPIPRRAVKHRAGADPAEWPDDLRIQEFPEPRR